MKSRIRKIEERIGRIQKGGAFKETIVLRRVGGGLFLVWRGRGAMPLSKALALFRADPEGEERATMPEGEIDLHIIGEKGAIGRLIDGKDTARGSISDSG